MLCLSWNTTYIAEHISYTSYYCIVDGYLFCDGRCLSLPCTAALTWERWSLQMFSFYRKTSVKFKNKHDSMIKTNRLITWETAISLCDLSWLGDVECPVMLDCLKPQSRPTHLSLSRCYAALSPSTPLSWRHSSLYDIEYIVVSLPLTITITITKKCLIENRQVFPSALSKGSLAAIIPPSQ